MTVREAVSRWCCQARSEVVKQVERGIMVPCIGDGCMAWRWANVEGVIYRGGVEQKIENYGYCGCAGSPERIS